MAFNQFYSRIDQETAQVVGRIISFAGVAGDVLHAVMEKTLGELGGYRGQPAKISGENSGVGLGVRKAAKDRTDPSSCLRKNLRG